MDIPSSVGVLTSYAHAWRHLKCWWLRLCLISLIPLILQGGFALLTGASADDASGAGALDLHGLLSLTPLEANVTLMDSALERIFSGSSGSATPNWSLIQIPLLTFFGPLSYALLFVYLTAARGERPGLADLFTRPGSVWSASIAATFMLTVLLLVAESPAVFIDFAVLRPQLEVQPAGAEILIWLLMPALFSIPCLIVGLRLSLAPFLVVDAEMGAWDAIAESWARTRGCLGTLAGICLLGVPLLVLGLACAIVGVIPAAVWIEMAFASFYLATAPDRAVMHAEADTGDSL